MRKFTIFVDMDDTIENLGDAWLVWLNVQHNLLVQKNQITHWRAFVDVFTERGLTIDQVYEPLHRREFWERVKPKSDAVVALKRLIDDGHRVYIATSSFSDVMYDKFDKALFPHFPYLTYKDIIITHDKGILSGDIIIDDYENNLLNSKCQYRILYNAVHNKDFNCEENDIIRAFNWDSIVEMISEWSKGDE